MRKFHEWEFWDWKTIIFCTLFFIGLVLFINYWEILPDYFRSNHSKKYTHTTQADFITWHRISGMTQGKTGNHISTSGFEITYSYLVNKKIFIGKDIVPNTISYQKFLGELTSAEGLPKFMIKYDPDCPSNSQINAKDNLYRLPQ